MPETDCDEISELMRRIKLGVLANDLLLVKHCRTCVLTLHYFKNAGWLGASRWVETGQIETVFGPFGAEFWDEPDPGDRSDRHWTPRALPGNGETGWYFDVKGDIYEGSSPRSEFLFETVFGRRAGEFSLRGPTAIPNLKQMVRYLSDLEATYS